MTMPMPNTAISSSDIQEVAEFEQAQAELQSFMDQHANIFNRYEQLAGQYNQRRQAADKVVRAKGVSCGPWVRFSQQEKVDWRGLYDYLGGDKEEYMDSGGTIQRTTTYGGDKKVLKIKIETGVYPKEDAGKFFTVSPRYKSPDPITLP